MMLTTKGRYAVMALADMAVQQRFLDTDVRAISLAEIASRQHITVAYLEQIFCKLKNAGIVRSQRGPGGGYIFARNTAEIKISEIITAAEEQVKMTRCGDEGKTPCTSGGSKCITHDLWDGLSNAIDGYLNSITLADIVAKKVNRVENLEFREEIAQFPILNSHN